MCTQSLFFKDFIYFYRQGKGGKKRGREISICGCLSSAPYWGLGAQPTLVPRWESNWRPFGSQADAQSTEPHQPGWHLFFDVAWLHFPLPAIRTPGLAGRNYLSLSKVPTAHQVPGHQTSSQQASHKYWWNIQETERVEEGLIHGPAPKGLSVLNRPHSRCIQSLAKCFAYSRCSTK